MREELLDLIREELRKSPGLSARKIKRNLEIRGIETRKGNINSILYGGKTEFKRQSNSQDEPPSWYIIDQSEEAERPVSLQAWNKALSQLQLRPWQGRAVEEWRRRGCRGVIEAVTGSGKTRIGLFAAYLAYIRNSRAVIIVPSVALMNQWTEQLLMFVPEKAIGFIGNGKKDKIKDHNIIVAIIKSASRVEILPKGFKGCLIADECHGYGTDKYSHALQKNFGGRLGLTATYERNDSGVETYLNPYFSGPCYELGYSEAIKERVISRFRIVTVGVKLDGQEQEDYDCLTERMNDSKRTLVKKYDLPSQPYNEFFVELTQTAASNFEGRKKKLARSYLSDMNLRKEILSSCQRKAEAVRHLARAIGKSKKALLFTQTIDSAIKYNDTLQREGLKGKAIHSNLNPEDREEILKKFKENKINYLVGPKVLDEGIDVPDADLAVVVSASRTRRQMVQRLGRILRSSQYDKVANLVIVCVSGSSEDPEAGGHEGFLDMVIDSAEEVQHFDADHNISEAVKYIRS